MELVGNYVQWQAGSSAVLNHLVGLPQLEGNLLTAIA
jgi:hypothetical protein